MIDRLLYEKPQKQTGTTFRPVDDKYVDTTDLSIDTDPSTDVNNDINYQSKTLTNSKHPNSRNIDETFSTDIFTPTTPPVQYERLVGSIKDGQMNVYALPFFFNDDEAQENRYKSYVTPLPPKPLNSLDGFYVKPGQNSKFYLKSPHKIDSRPQTGVLPGFTLFGSGANSQQSDLTVDKDLKGLLQKWLQENKKFKLNKDWREGDETLADYYDNTDSDILSLNNADLSRFSDYLKSRLKQSQDPFTSQDVFTNHSPHHVKENPQQITQIINSLLGVSSSASTEQKSVCWDGQILHNYTLVGGINAGTFTDNGKTSNMDICMQYCCKRESCDLAFMIEDDCYSVACNSNGACEPRKARPTHYFPRIAIRKKPQGEKYLLSSLF